MTTKAYELKNERRKKGENPVTGDLTKRSQEMQQLKRPQSRGNDRTPTHRASERS